jgi:hypothetical protein
MRDARVLYYRLFPNILVNGLPSNRMSESDMSREFGISSFTYRNGVSYIPGKQPGGWSPAGFLKMRGHPPTLALNSAPTTRPWDLLQLVSPNPIENVPVDSLYESSHYRSIYRYSVSTAYILS